MSVCGLSKGERSVNAKPALGVVVGNAAYTIKAVACLTCLALLLRMAAAMGSSTMRRWPGINRAHSLST